MIKKTFSYFFLILMLACSNQDSPGTSVDTPAKYQGTIAIPTDSTPNNNLEAYSDIFSVTVKSSRIALNQWDSTIDLEKILGPPVKERIKQLDKNSDTHAGSFIKDIEYQGIKFKLFSPPQNGQSFWIQEIILTSNQYKTSRNITIDDALEKVKEAYPDLAPFPGINKNMYYVANDGYEKSVEMEFSNDRLIKLRMYCMLP